MSKDDIERIEEVKEWYVNTADWLQTLASALHQMARKETPIATITPSGLFQTPSEIEDSLNAKLDHSSTASSMKLFAAFEGALRYDTKHRQRKGGVGKDLKRMIKQENLKDIDIADIINCWRARYMMTTTFSILKGLFKYRHWLAHGRYWDNVGYPVKKSAITPTYIYYEMRECFDEFKRHEADFGW